MVCQIRLLYVSMIATLFDRIFFWKGEHCCCRFQKLPLPQFFLSTLSAVWLHTCNMGQSKFQTYSNSIMQLFFTEQLQLIEICLHSNDLMRLNVCLPQLSKGQLFGAYAMKAQKRLHHPYHGRRLFRCRRIRRLLFRPPQLPNHQEPILEVRKQGVQAREHFSTVQSQITHR